MSGGHGSAPASGADPAPSQGGRGEHPPLFVAQYEDRRYTFREGTRMRFGRDPGSCEIPVQKDDERRLVSAQAGELWCSSGKLWVENLSRSHELLVAEPGMGQLVLYSRPHGPGNACSVPPPTAELFAPSTGTWRIVVTACTDVNPGRADFAAAHAGGASASSPLPAGPPPAIPTEHREVALALVAPLLVGGTEAATFVEISRKLGITPRQAQAGVEGLCLLYRPYVQEMLGGTGTHQSEARALAAALVELGLFNTLRVREVPAELRDVARALCAPRIAGEPRPATYKEVQAALGCRTLKVARGRVDELCRYYQGDLKALSGAQRPGEYPAAAVARLLHWRGMVPGPERVQP